jgi:histidine ammonia-lyase
MTTGSHVITNGKYSIEDVVALVEERPQLELDGAIRAAIIRGAAFVRSKAEEGSHIYGVNTGFGAMCETRIPASDMHELQRNLILSHAAGVGEMADEDTCRATLLLKLLTFRTGHTGISIEVVERLLEFWNNGVVPATPTKGTVGASGDLAPLAHISLPLLGLGHVYVNGAIRESGPMLAERDWEPIVLGPKEGLALINGVQYITAVAAACLARAARLATAADVVASVSLQAFCTSKTFFHELYHSLTAHQERRDVAAHLSTLVEGGNHWSLPQANRSMQDPYSFRCIPQVHGAVRQALRFATQTVESEINSVGDNPLFFPKQDQILFGGNLHGESTAMALDFAAIAVSELSSISERRSYQLLSGERGLPDFLAPNPGLHSGYMIAQYTAAALVNQNKVLATPSSIDSIMTSQLQEDHVSMGGTGALKLPVIVDNCETVIALELLLAAQAAELQEGLVLSEPARELVTELRTVVPFLDVDRVVAPDIAVARRFLSLHASKWFDRQKSW